LKTALEKQDADDEHSGLKLSLKNKEGTQ
jgi:hypothetical protein